LWLVSLSRETSAEEASYSNKYRTKKTIKHCRDLKSFGCCTVAQGVSNSTGTGLCITKHRIYDIYHKSTLTPPTFSRKEICIYRACQKSIPLKNFVYFSRTIERYDIKFYTLITHSIVCKCGKFH